VNEPAPPDPMFPRLSKRPFPAYRYVPGRTLHPRADAGGHSYGKTEPDFVAEALDAREDWRASPRFCYSVDLYNFAYWWEAHEGWEGLWRCYEPEDPLRYGLQVFIQVSAAHLQRFMGNADGVRRLLKHARLHLDAADAVKAIMFGCELEKWFSTAVTPYFAGERDAGFPFLRPK
jgi:hypothetical protein